MQKYIKNDLTDVRYFEDDVDVADWIDLNEYRSMTEAEIIKHESPKLTQFHTVWNGSDWIDPRSQAEIEAHRLVQFPALKRRQFMRVLVLNGFDLDQIEAEINKIPDTQTRQLALIDWKDATEFWRTDETLLMVADLLGLDTARIDAMWEQGSTL